MQKALHSEIAEALSEFVRPGLTRVSCYNNAAHVKAQPAENVGEAQNIVVIAYAQVSAQLVFLDVVSVYGDYNFNFIAYFREHSNFRVRLKSR